MDTNPAHVEPPPILLIKEISNGNSDGDCVKLKLSRYPTSSTSYIYEFRMSLFDHGDPEGFLLFMQNFQITLAATGTLETEARFQYLRKLFHGEELRQFDLVPDDAKNTETQLYVDYLLKGLA